MDDLSYSMYIDNSNNLILHRYTNVWIDDTQVTSCHRCQVQFGIFIRRHHCRFCGKIFCYRCCSNYIDVSSKCVDSNGVINRDMYFRYITHPILGRVSSYRVCVDCYYIVTLMKRVSITYIILSRLYDLKDIHSARLVCKDWKYTCDIILSSFREIQYLIEPNQRLTPTMQDIIRSNLHYLSGHSRLLVWYIKVVKDIPIDILYQQRHVHCWSLMCRRECRQYINDYDCIHLLVDRLPESIQKYCIDILLKTPIERIEIYIPYLVYSIRHNTLLSTMLNHLSITNIGIKFYYFWNLITEIQYHRHRRNTDLVSIYQDAYHSLVRVVTLDDINSSYTFINLAAKLRDNSGDNYIDRILNPILNMRVPVNPYLTVRYIDYNSVVIKDSSTSPVIITCIVESDNINPNSDVISTSPIHTAIPMSSSPVPKQPMSGYWYQVMYKKTDVRYDQTVMSLIRLSDQILKENGMDLDIVTYRVLPTGYHSGLIEVVPNSETVNSLVSTQSIQNYIMEFNPGEKVGTIKQRFINSMASYCVIMYLLGVGDRHLDNIMITRNGRLFHIDFTYLLGNDPKPLAPKMRITEEMVDVLGGVDSRYYRNFINICTRCYDCLRRYDYLFYCLLTPLTELGLSNLEGEIRRRFLPGEQKANIQLVKTINDSTTSYRYNIIDILHEQSKLIRKIWSMLKI